MNTSSHYADTELVYLVFSYLTLTNAKALASSCCMWAKDAQE